jgi:hypothetical protein
MQHQTRGRSAPGAKRAEEADLDRRGISHSAKPCLHAAGHIVVPRTLLWGTISNSTVQHPNPLVAAHVRTQLL